MITPIQSGVYKLIETKNQIKILYLDDTIYAWPETKLYGEMLVASHRLHKSDRILATGRYNLYEVDDEPAISDTMHLELEAGRGVWQGYLLLTGLPNKHKLRCRIIPTHEVITDKLPYNPSSVTRSHSNKIVNA